MTYRKRLCGVLCAAALCMTACSADPAPTPQTDVTTTQAEGVTTTEATTTTTAAVTEEAPPMMFDLKTHWNEGETPTDHRFEDNDICETCGVEKTVLDSMTAVSYSDSFGNLLKVLRYEGETLVGEDDYVYYEEMPATYCAKTVAYYDSGAVSSVTETEESGNSVLTNYDEQGNVTETVETTFDESGNMLSVTYDAEKQVTEKVNVEYDGLGNSFTSVFNGEDTLVSTEEVIYDEDMNFTNIYIFYNEDGSVSYKEVWETTDEGQTKTVYDADGNVTETKTF